MDDENRGFVWDYFALKIVAGAALAAGLLPVCLSAAGLGSLWSPAGAPGGAFARVPASEAFRNRTMIEPSDSCMPRFTMPWVAGRGLRVRVAYLHPPGVTEADETGFHAIQNGRVLSEALIPVPARYRGIYPLYFRGQRARFELEIENTGGYTLSNVAVQAGQEAFDMGGGAGPALATPRSSWTIPSLAPGEKTIVSGMFEFTYDAAQHVNFEQTHVRVTSGSETLLDAPQAGIADPPSAP